MAAALPPFTFENGFRQPASTAPWLNPPSSPPSSPAHYTTPPSALLPTSTHLNSLGPSTQRVWPTLFNGTNTPHLPPWFHKPSQVDVLICGAGPSGLEVALSLARQGISFRIVDKSPGPLLSGRADGVQPRFLETLHHWGLSSEVAEEGPLIAHTAIYKDGQKLLFAPSHQSDSRYRGLHIITQGQIERIFIRDLVRHRKLVERLTAVKGFEVEDQGEYPVRVTLEGESGEEVVRARYMVGADGAGSVVRKGMGVEFEGVSTDIYWGIMDCRFESDYPHAWMFGTVINSEHGGCVIIPREDGYIRLYTQLDTARSGPLGRSRQAADSTFAEAGGSVDVHSITPDEVLAQANRIFAPYTLKFASPLSWFAVWKISERVARTFSHKNRIHLVGDAAHVHSVMGAFGLNASILDASNLAWKLALCSRGLAIPEALLPTYSSERRRHAVRIVETSGVYLRFVCNSSLPPVNLSGIGTEPRHDESGGGEDEAESAGEGESRGLGFLKRFFAKNGQFLLGVDAPYGNSVLNPARSPDATSVKNGVRAPNPRVCVSAAKSGYLYDALGPVSHISLVVFGSDLQGPVRAGLVAFARALEDPGSFYHRFGGAGRFRVVLVTKLSPGEAEEALVGEIGVLGRQTVVYDDRAPDEDAHGCYGVDHARGAVVVVRPDLWVGVSVGLGEVEELGEYFGGWLVDVGFGEVRLVEGERREEAVVSAGGGRIKG